MRLCDVANFNPLANPIALDVSALRHAYAMWSSLLGMTIWVRDNDTCPWLDVLYSGPGDSDLSHLDEILEDIHTQQVRVDITGKLFGRYVAVAFWSDVSLHTDYDAAIERRAEERADYSTYQDIYKERG